MEKLENMSNAEIKIYQKTLENEFDSIKSEISERMDRLDALERKYENAQKEIDKRSKKNSK